MYKEQPSIFKKAAKRIKYVAAAAITAVAIGATVPAHAAGMLLTESGFGGRLEIKEHTVDVTINNGIAVTEVTQIFENKENRQVEALYTFPVPNGASVSNFSMWINGKEMIGEVVEKERAREIYESYKRVRKDPGLLEQVDFKTFEMRVFPIAPLAEQRIQVKYYQELDVDADWVNYVYPLATNTKGQVDRRVTGKFAVTMRVKSEVPIWDMESPSHGDDFVFVQHNDQFVETSLEMNEGDLTNDVVLAYNTIRPHTGVDIITSATGKEDGYFYATLTPGKELADAGAAMDYLFILDISGSMSNDGKLAASTRSVSAFVDALPAESRFDVMTFNVAPVPLFGQLESVNDANQDQAREFVNSQRARGGTVLQSALRAAYNYVDPEGDRLLNLVILSDGLTQPNDQRALLDTSGERPENARIFCIGVGNEVNRPVLSQLAEDAGGLAAFISRGGDFERQAKAFQRKLIRPVATDVSIQVVGAKAYDIVPANLPNLYHGSPMRVYGRYKDAGDAEVIVHGFVEGQAFETRVSFNFPERNDDNPEIERMWAFKTIQGILDQSRKNEREPNRADVDEIVRLGEGYSIVTEYTSFLVLENEGEYKRWKIERRNALRENRDRRAQDKFTQELNAIRQQASAEVGPMKREKMAKKTEKPNRNNVSQPLNRQFDQSQRSDSSSRDVSIKSPGLIRGGGAFDPITGGICALLAGTAFAARRKKD
jgi:Ca-activated chloride channel family protein